MSFLDISIELVQRLISENNAASISRCRLELRSLLASNNQAWLPEGIEDGGEAFEVLWRRTSSEEKVRLEEFLIELTNEVSGTALNDENRRILANIYYTASRLRPLQRGLGRRLLALDAKTIFKTAARPAASHVYDKYGARLANGLLTLAAANNGTDISTEEARTFALIASMELTSTETIGCYLKVLNNAIWGNRHHIIYATFKHAAIGSLLELGPNRETWVNDASQRKNELPSAHAEKLIRLFFTDEARSCFLGEIRAEGLVVYASFLDFSYLNGSAADGTFSFIANSVLGDDVRGTAKRLGIGEEILEEITEEQAGILNLQASESLKLCQAAFFNVLADKFGNELDKIEAAIPYTRVEALEFEAKKLAISNEKICVA